MPAIPTCVTGRAPPFRKLHRLIDDGGYLFAFDLPLQPATDDLSPFIIFDAVWHTVHLTNDRSRKRSSVKEAIRRIKGQVS